MDGRMNTRPLPEWAECFVQNYDIYYDETRWTPPRITPRDQLPASIPPENIISRDDFAILLANDEVRELKNRPGEYLRKMDDSRTQRQSWGFDNPEYVWIPEDRKST